MSKTPGRKPQHSPFKKRQLSSDAKILVTLIKNQPQTKEELFKETKISDSTFHRNISFLKELKIIKCVDGMYALFNFDFIEKTIEAAMTRLLGENGYVNNEWLINEVGKSWPEIKAQTYKVAKKLGFDIEEISNNKTTFMKYQKNIS